MKILKSQLLFLSLIISCSVFSQTLQQYQIGVGNSSNVLSGSSSLKYENGTLTMGSTGVNYLLFQNGSGNGYFGFDANGDFGWWTPSSSGSRKMLLNNSGQLKLGSYATSGDAGAEYKLQVDGGGFFKNKLTAYRTLGNADLSSGYANSGSAYLSLTGNITNTAYNIAQSNYFQGFNGTMIGLQSAAQVNEAHFYNVNYSDAGPGHIWSVQTNRFSIDGTSSFTKYVNTYMSTILRPGSTIGTYYTLYLEAPFGNGNVSQISNYWGLYQESIDAKNYMAGKVGIGTTNLADNNYKLFVETGIRTRKIKVDQTTWADYVFEPTYYLPSLKEVEAHIKQFKHLPGVLSAKEVEAEGLDLGENQATLLKKIEELTLYVIDLQKQVDDQKKQIMDLRSEKK